MQYNHTQNPVQDAGKIVGETLKRHLDEGERVTWLLSGGSGKGVAHAALPYLSDANLENLYISLTDERFGPVGHPDENWQQLLDEGFSAPGASLYRPLKDVDAETTAKDFGDWLGEQCAESDFCLAIFGMGTDGHTVGIKPQSPAFTANSLAVAYAGEDFERITMTPAAFSCVNQAVIQVSGSDKKDALRKLLRDSPAPTDQPAQLLKTIPKIALYTNIPEEELS